MARQITKEHAKAIIRKLGAKKSPKTSKAHDMMIVMQDGIIIASFGIRRGSNRDQGHDHVPKAIHVQPNFAKRLAECSKSRADWIAEMIRLNII